MSRYRMRRRWAPVLLVVAGIALGGCSSAGHASGPVMMGGDSAYHYSSLSCSAPTLPGATVQVTLADMGMTQMMGGTAPTDARMMLRATPVAVPAGKVSFVAANMGWRTHELVVLPLADAATAGRRIPGGDGRIDEAGSAGEASAGCAAGGGDGIASGQVGWVTMTLAPGRYELLCNLPNHYADGMFAEFVVS